MHLNIPPVIPYAVGAMLVIFGVLRIKYLSAPRAPKVVDDADPGEESVKSSSTLEVRGPEQRRHLRMGVVWILLGLFLVVSTVWQMRRR
jgi:predicted nucleic acid-binding Zn ribbon protein